MKKLVLALLAIMSALGTQTTKPMLTTTLALTGGATAGVLLYKKLFSNPTTVNLNTVNRAIGNENVVLERPEPIDYSKKTLHNWCKRCTLRYDPNWFAKVYHQNNFKDLPSNVTAQEFETLLTTFTKEAKSLLQKGQWVASCPKDMRSRVLVQKSLVKPTTTVHIFADRHGDNNAFLATLVKLRKAGIVGDRNSQNDYRINGDHFFVFLGDYGDRGAQSIEVYMTLLTFWLANPQKVVLLRGNHELEYIAKRYGLYEEFAAKFRDLKPQELKTLWDSLITLWDLLPCALYLGFESTDKIQKFGLLAHAGPEIGYNPQKLLSTKGTIVYDSFALAEIPHLRANEFNLITGTTEGKKAFGKLCQNTTWIGDQSPEFYWTDFTLPGKEAFLNTGRGLALSSDSFTALLKYWNTQNIMVEYLIRGHQHTASPKDPFMQKILAGNGAYRDNNVITLLLAPDSFFGQANSQISYDTSLTVTAADKAGSWKYTVTQLPLSEIAELLEEFAANGEEDCTHALAQVNPHYF